MSFFFFLPKEVFKNKQTNRQNKNQSDLERKGEVEEHLVVLPLICAFIGWLLWVP